MAVLDWEKYIERLRKVNDTATAKIKTYLDTHAIKTRDEIKAMLDYAYAISTKYGEAAAALAADMYDDILIASGVAGVPYAEPAEIETYRNFCHEVMAAYNGMGTKEIIPAVVSRYVKMAGVDTMLKNAINAGAEYAWIPHGDTCAYCIMLAGMGWQRASKSAMEGGHAKHVHANCDCTYAIRFNDKVKYPSYRPQMYARVYENAEGATEKEKLNSMRRAFYAENKEAVNEQKRAAYAARRRAEKLKFAGAYESNDYKSVYAEYLDAAKPGTGKALIASGRKLKNMEEANLRLLHKEFGGDIVANAERRGHKVKTPDYTWRGKEWEEKDLTTHTENAIDKSVREATKQIKGNPGGVILDIGDGGVPLEVVHEIALRRLRRSADFDCDVIIIRNGKVVDVTRYKNGPVSSPHQ